VHIFWQKRIVEGDVETKWWYPFKTENGALRADRIVFPIPQGTHWKDVRDRYLEHVNQNGALLPSGKYDVARALPDPSQSAKLLAA
jgi:hypothetical protein